MPVDFVQSPHSRAIIVLISTNIPDFIPVLIPVPISILIVLPSPVSPHSPHSNYNIPDSIPVPILILIVLPSPVLITKSSLVLGLADEIANHSLHWIHQGRNLRPNKTIWRELLLRLLHLRKGRRESHKYGQDYP